MMHDPVKLLTNGPRLDGEPNQPTKHLMEAAVRLAKKRNKLSRRHTPSPSSVEYCTRRNWFNETGVEPTETPDAESFLAAESGRLTESLIIDVVNELGYGHVDPLTEKEREINKVALRRLNLRGGQFDQLLIVKNTSGEDDDVILLEFKRKSVYNFLDVVRKGLLEGNPNEYQQVQLMLSALHLERCLYVAANWDRASLTSACRGKYRPPGIYGEWIEASPLAAEQAARRAAKQLKYIKNEPVAAKVPRDYEPHGGDKADWQCRWCPWWTACLKAEKGVK